MTLTLQAVNLYNQCFQRGYAWDNSVTCVYSSLPSNILAPAGNFRKNPPPQLRYPYGTFFNVTEVGITSVRQPFSFFADLSIKLVMRLNDERSRFIRDSGMAAFGAAAAPQFVARASSAARGSERVAIVGAGIAGLVTAHASARRRHRRDDLRVLVARRRPHAFGAQSYWDDGQHTEWCGAMVDSHARNIHAAWRAASISGLARHARGAAAARARHVLPRRPLLLDGRRRSRLREDLSDSAGAARHSGRDDHVSPTRRRRRAGSIAMSMRDWIERYVPGGFDSQLGRLIDESYRNEYGREIERAQRAQPRRCSSASSAGTHEPRAQRARLLRSALYLGERGSQALPEAIAASLPAGSVLLRPPARRDPPQSRAERTSCASIAAERAKRVYADRVVLAIPFIVLRGGRLLRRRLRCGEESTRSRTSATAITRSCICSSTGERGCARTHPWPEPTTGQIWTTLPVQSALDYSLGQRGHDGLIEVFTAAGPAMLDTPPMPYARIADLARGRSARARRFFDAARSTSGPASRRHGTVKRRSETRKPIRTFARAIRVGSSGSARRSPDTKAAPQGRVHFAGEHTSVAYQGFMEGGASRDFRAADEILADYRIRVKRAA